MSLLKGFWEFALAPRSFFIQLGMLCAVLSVLILLRDGLGLSLSYYLAALLDLYNNATFYVLGWVEPLFSPLIAWASNIVQIELVLSDIWRHVFIFMTLYILRSIGFAIVAKKYIGAAIKLLFGMTTSLFAALVVGVVVSNQAGLVEDIIILSAIAFSYIVYDLFNSLWSIFFVTPQEAKKYNHEYDFGAVLKQYVTFILTTGFICLAFSLSLLIIPFVRNLSFPGLFLASVYILCVALLRLWRAVHQVNSGLKSGAFPRNYSWSHYFWNQGAARIGGSVVGVFVWDIFILSIDSAVTQFITD